MQNIQYRSGCHPVIPMVNKWNEETTSINFDGYYFIYSTATERSQGEVGYGCSNVAKLSWKKNVIFKNKICMIFTKSFLFQNKLFV